MSRLFDDFKQYLAKMQQYDHVITLLNWDIWTKTPKLGQAAHIDALTYFSAEKFAMSTAEELGDMLDALAAEEAALSDEAGLPGGGMNCGMTSGDDALDDTWKFIVRRMKRDFDRDRRIPAELYEAFVRAKAESGAAWEEAKKASDFSIYAPHLQKMIDMRREVAGYTDPGKEPYDAMLDEFEEGVSSADIDRLFGALKRELIPLVQKITAMGQPEDARFHEYADVDEQKKVQRMLLDYIGFRRDAGAVDETEHPLTLSFSTKDVRIANHYHEHDPLSAIFSAIHEGGHGIFDQNVNPAYDRTVAGSCCYMGIHESQSRFYENILGRNKNFWIPVYGKLGEVLPQFKKISLDDFYREINHVKNSFIRTEADELTYCFHIILRYEMEQAIFRDNVPAEELPALWNKKMQEYLQVTPKNDSEGILQDIHWSDASFGYFPSYLLGSIYDGMYLEAMEKELGSVDELLAAGRILEITKWLNEKIHWYGSTRKPKEVIEAVCGREVSAEPLIRYFKKKYTEIYGL